MVDEKQDEQSPNLTDGAIDWTTEPAPIFANGAHVTSAGQMFAIAFAEFFPGRGVLQRKGDKTFVRAQIVSSIRMSANDVPSLITALAGRWNLLANQVNSAGGTRLPKFKLIGADERWQQVEGLSDDERAP